MTAYLYIYFYLVRYSIWNNPNSEGNTSLGAGDTASTGNGLQEIHLTLKPYDNKLINL